MDFTQKYQLVELLAGDGAQSYRARQTNTGREVTVHLLVGGKTTENEALLVRLRALQPASMAKLIEVGEHQGNTFVVTVAPPYERLEAWLAEQDKAAAAAKEFGRAGFWKLPDAEALAATAPKAVPAAPVAGPVTGGAAVPAVPAVPAAEAGEFTRMFQGPAAGAVTGGGAVPAVQASGGSVSQGPAAGIPTAGVTNVAGAPAVPASGGSVSHGPAAGPGEFTRLFQSPMPDVAAPGDWPAAAPKAAEAGEFTRMFQAPAGARETGPGAGPATGAGGEFTQFFKPAAAMPAGPQFPSASEFPQAAPAVAPPAPASGQEPGEYTRMFGPGTLAGAPGPPAAPASGPAAGVPGAPVAHGAGGGATQAFRVAPGGVPAGVPAGAPQGPSEYTRMMSVPAGVPGAAQTGMGGAVPPPTAYAPPPMPQMAAPQMAAPQVAGPQVAGLARQGLSALPVAILCLLSFLAGVIVTYLLVRRG